MTLSDLIHDYEQKQPNRALGGLRALSGFDFQLRCHLAEFVEHLAAGNGILQGGQAFAQGLEALSDFTTTKRDELVCVQAKRTLTTTTMAHAAVEFATIAEFLKNSLTPGAAEVSPRFRVVGNRSELAADWSWDTVTLPANELSKRPDLQQVWQSLVEEQRVDSPQVEPDPWWRVIAATFDKLDKPFEFSRQALDLCLSRHESSAKRIRDDIAELFRKHLSPTPLKNFQAVIESDFAPDPDDRLQPLRVGYRPSLALVRNRQFMTRDVHVRNAIKCLDALLMNQDYGNVSGLPVLWISGPSGCGKSVLLLQMLESLVKSGHSAVWLEDDARRVVPLLKAFCAERDAESADLPGFLFIDDLYSPTNQQRVDLTELETLVGDRPFERWPVVITCGPPEFFERLERESSGSELYLKHWSLPLVEIQPFASGEPAEADLLTAWFQQRTGEQPQRGSAFDRDQGLMISMAYELRFEDPKALKPFASRFRDRLKADDLDQNLVLPLALNRLYLFAPADWLEESDRERFETVNREGDFSILDLGSDGEFLRLTHPHISDAIYRAIRDPASQRAFANDLAEAMRRAMVGNITTLRLLLRALSSADPRITERLKDVDLDHLAELVTADWKQSDVESRLRGSELADINTSWACWHARKPELRLEQRLGHSLFAAARAALRTAESAWSTVWQRLRAAYPDDTCLLADAVDWMHEAASGRLRGWSFIWEEVWRQRALPGLPFDERTLVLCAFGWLVRHWDQKDWHFVWTKLVNRPSEGINSKISEVSANFGSLSQIIELGWQWLIHQPSSVRSGVVSHQNLAAWAYVWQDLLQQQRFESEPAHGELLKEGVAWLEGREDRSEWSHVWRQLMESPSVPQGMARDELLTRGVAWLEGREDRSEWSHVWQRLLESPSLPQGMARDELLTRGVAWLEGREDRNEWAFVWQWLLESPSLPPGITRDDLLTRGVAWLEGREDRSEWNYVWRQLLESPSLPQGITRDELLTRGVAWLEGREDRNEWAFVWERILESRKASTAAQFDVVLRLGHEWLVRPTNRTRPEWDKLLENWIDAGGDDSELLRAAADWIMLHQRERQVPPLAAKVLRATRVPATFDHIAAWLAEWCKSNPDAGQSKFVIGFLRTEQGNGWTPSSGMPGWKSLLDWLAVRSPSIHRVGVDDSSALTLQQMQATGQRVFGRITQRVEKGFLVELRLPEICAFLPGSQVDLRAPTDWDAFVGLECEFAIEDVSIEKNRWSIIVSRRRVLEAEQSARIEALLRELHAGDKVVGTVVNLVNYGAFIDFGGVVGLLHLTEMTWHRPTCPADYCQVGQQLELVVLRIDISKRQVALGLKQLTPSPW
jgi:hypothetical protein